MKRLIALLLIVIFFPIVIITALLIKWNYPGPIFYKQIREGKGGKPFKIIKMRTMIVNSEAILKKILDGNPNEARLWAETGVLKNDPRIAGKLGKLSRQLSLDEFPQLINVLKGEMSFVGPRPLEIPTVESINQEFRKIRYSVLPGITGLAQVENRSATIRQMFFYDRIYIKNQTIKMDVYILMKTFFSILKRTGA